MIRGVMSSSGAINARRMRISVRGAVQGVGFRPFVFRLARELGLVGWVCNTAQGAQVEAEGAEAVLRVFSDRLHAEKPPAAFYTGFESAWLDPVGHAQFEIRPSEGGERTALVLPDIAVCGDCLRELFDAADRRYRYPFINCTNCGPRYSIIEALPYDRARTTMKGFTMCGACQAEYEDPRNRRFHAQPNACPVCGPQLAWWTGAGETVAARDAALRRAAAAIRAGQVVALKGIGGFQLLVDARREEAVRRLRERKHREEKPLAVMCPDMASVKAWCEVSEGEGRRLASPEAPIVLLRGGGWPGGKARRPRGRGARRGWRRAIRIWG